MCGSSLSTSRLEREIQQLREKCTTMETERHASQERNLTLTTDMR
jgi:hypothetical protein